MNLFLPLRMRLFLTMLLTLALLPMVGHGDWTTNFLYRTSSNGMPYRLFVPWDYSPSARYPVVLYLHFAGHEGTDNETHMYEAVAAKTNWMAEGAFVLCPQSTIGAPQQSWPYGFAFEPEVIRARECLAEVEEGYSVDTRRFYVSGISAGGDGSWRIISIYTNTFAAAAPVVGMGDIFDPGQTSAWAPRLIDTPVWAFSGENDLFRMTATGYMFDQIEQAVIDAGGSPDTNVHRHTVFPGIGHSGVVHDMALGAGLTPWMFDQELWSMHVPHIAGVESAGGGHFVIRWETSPGKTYRVQAATNLPGQPMTWSNVYEVVGNGAVTTYTNAPSGAHQAFCRVVLDIPR